MASAKANGGDASAYASVEYLMEQGAEANGVTGADANASVTNSGTMSVMALANATATDFARAHAIVDTGISQYATAHAKSGPANADVTLTNSNTIVIGAAANASGSGAQAIASITDHAIFQSAYASGTAGSATAVLTNTGNITIAASANAVATNNTAFAYATVDTGIWQTAQGVDHASASLSNATGANISIAAMANASGQGGALASAFVDTGISQDARATGVGGSATDTLTNNGVITIGASANAFAGREGNAAAYATIDTAFWQWAEASAAANVSIVNNGTINVLAAASASGDEGANAGWRNPHGRLAVGECPPERPVRRPRRSPTVERSTSPLLRTRLAERMSSPAPLSTTASSSTPMADRARATPRSSTMVR